MNRIRDILVWAVPFAIIAVALIASSQSPQLAWRRPVYIASGFAGVVGMALLLLQPLLAGRYFPGINARRSRLFHQTGGALLVLAVLVHVIGLWITSPPDMVDALLLRSPTPFSIWGVVAMWAIFGTGLLAAFKARLKMLHQNWRLIHFAFALTAAICSVAHAMQIEGTMETISKTVLCGLALSATAKLGYDLLIRRPR